VTVLRTEVEYLQIEPFHCVRSPFTLMFVPRNGTNSKEARERHLILASVVTSVKDC